MAGVFFNLPTKSIDGAQEPDWKTVLTPSLSDSLMALSEGVRDQRPKYEAAIQRLVDLRAQLSLRWGKSATPIDSVSKFLEEVLRPYMQLVADTRMYFTLPSEDLPDNAAKLMSAGGPLKFLAFKWKCAFASTTLLSGNVNVELCSLLFNAGVITFNSATNTMFQSAESDSCKKGFQDFQAAAGAFEAGRELAATVSQSQLSFDIIPSSFELLRDIALCMAHRCAYLKACVEPATKDKKELLSKLANTGVKHLRACVTAATTVMEGRSVNDDFRTIIKNLQDNAALLEGEAYEHVMEVELKANQCGAVIAKGRVAMMVVTNQANGQGLCASASNKQWLTSKASDLKALHDQALGYNNTVYFQRVPEAIEPLPHMDKVLGKPTQFFADWHHVDEKSGEPFKGLVGPDIIPMLSQFRETVTAEFGKLSRSVSQKRSESSDALSRLELDALLCHSEEGQKPQLPPAMRAKVQTLQQQARTYNNSGSGGDASDGGNPAAMVQAMLRHVANVCAAVEPILADCEATMQKEKERDEKYVHAYGEKLWRSRVMPSEQLPDTPNFRKRIAEIRNTTSNESREVLQGIVRTLNEHTQPLLRVGLPVEDLDAMIPASEAPTREQEAANVIRGKLRELRQNFESVNETEMSLLRAIPPMISSPDTAAALCAAKKEDREAVLSKKQVELIDSFAGVQALADQRVAILDEMEKLVLELATTESDDPLLKEKAAVIKSVERGIQVVEGAVMRISDLSMQVSNFMEAANMLRQSCESLVKARELEARNVASQLDQQIQQQMARMQQQQTQQQVYIQPNNDNNNPTTSSSSSGGGGGTGSGGSSSSNSNNNQGQQHQQYQQYQQQPSHHQQQQQQQHRHQQPMLDPFAPQQQHQQHQQYNQNAAGGGLAPPPPPPSGAPPSIFGGPSGQATYNPPSFTDPSQRNNNNDNKSSQQGGGGFFV